MKNAIILFIGILFSTTLFAQSKKLVTTTFEVSAVCEMCKERILKAIDVKGVKNADYKLSTHQLTVTYVPAKISIEQIHFLINNVGHDTSLSKAPDEKYSKIHSCCNYREHTHNHGEEEEEEHHEKHPKKQ
ncbi:MAG: heavy-metal-associated domain-containing protein [Flavobacteriales bacterium]